MIPREQIWPGRIRYLTWDLRIRAIDIQRRQWSKFTGTVRKGFNICPCRRGDIMKQTKDIFAEYIIWGLQDFVFILLLFSILKMLIHCLLACKVSEGSLLYFYWSSYIMYLFFFNFGYFQEFSLSLVVSYLKIFPSESFPYSAWVCFSYILGSGIWRLLLF